MERNTQHADTIFHNGKMLPVADDSVQQAVAVHGERILAVGSDGEVLALAGPGTKQVDLRGRTLIPGIVDIHAHMDREGLKNDYPSLAGVCSIPDVLEIVRSEVASKSPGEWVVTMPLGEPPNYTGMPEGLAEGRYPTRHDLDQVSPNNPVYLRGIWTPWNMPPSVSVANSVALQMAGVDRGTASPDETVTIECDDNGDPTGVFTDSNPYPSVEFTLMRVVPRFTHAQRVEAMKESMQIYSSVGTTGTYEGHGIAPEVLRVYKEVWDAGEMKQRVHLTLSPSWSSIAEAEDDMARWGHSASGTGFGDDMLKISGYHIQYGGSPYLARARSAELPFTGWAGFAESHHSPEMFRDLVRLAGLHNLRVNTLVRGNLEEVLQVFEAVDLETPIAHQRWVLVHILRATDDQMHRMKRLGLVLETIPLTDLWLRGHALPAAQPREGAADAHRTYERLGIPYSFGTDNKPYNPFETLWAAITRQEGRSGQPLDPDECLTRMEALRAFTLGGAYFSFDEGERGSLEPGKLADLAVLSDDYLSMPMEEMSHMRSLLTMVGGRVVHDAGEV